MNTITPHSPAPHRGGADRRLVDVLLPLALPGAYTYRLPDALTERVGTGSRVVVQFGPRKHYSAIVVRHPGTPPAQGVELKEVEELVDEAPLLLPAQLELWRWMARYYLCTPGEVMKAALPSGLKLESEMLVEPAPEAGAEMLRHLPPRAAEVLEALRDEKAMTAALLAKKTGTGAALLPLLRRLIEAGAVKVHEAMGRTLRPRTEAYVVPAAKLADEAAQHAALDALHAAPKQARLLALLLGEGEVARARLPQLMEGAEAALGALRRKGYAEVEARAVDRLRPHQCDASAARPPLSRAQQEAADAVVRCWRDKAVCLLHGVTSSGKTEIYIHLIEQALDAGMQVLYLVPEIALTTQITTRLARVFGARMGVYHSRFPDAERAELWQRQLTDRAFPLILGARSALFLPYRRLGLIIVDEEHETSYKQQEPAPRYNARHGGGAGGPMRGEGAAGHGHARGGDFLQCHRNEEVRLRTAHAALRRRDAARDSGGGREGAAAQKLMKTPLAPRLIEEVRQALAQGQQAILFQNRRGYAPVLECRACGWTPRCTACDVSLTFHQQSGRLVCHYCGASYEVPRRCPCCEETDLRDIGYGTEKVEEAVKQLFPEARVARMDLDTTRSRTAYERIINDFQRGETDLLIGTQMVTKGLDFDRVRVVGILSADQMLSQPNFRAYERAFQMMAQVAGRAGRRDARGLVVLQTRQPGLPVVRQVAANDYGALFASQLVERDMFRYPPFFRIIDIYLRHRKEEVCAHAADELGALLRPHFGADLLGPDRPAVGRIQSMHIRKLVLKLTPALPASGVRRTLLAARDVLLARPAYRSVALHFDVDPL